MPSGGWGRLYRDPNVSHPKSGDGWGRSGGVSERAPHHTDTPATQPSDSADVTRSLGHMALPLPNVLAEGSVKTGQVTKVGIPDVIGI